MRIQRSGFEEGASLKWYRKGSSGTTTTTSSGTTSVSSFLTKVEVLGLLPSGCV